MTHSCPTRRSSDLLADSRWKGEAAIANPLYGPTTMHAAALFATLGEEEARRFFEALKANDVRVAGSNGEVRSVAVEGEVPFGLTDNDDCHDAGEGEAPVQTGSTDRQGKGWLG